MLSFNKNPTSAFGVQEPICASWMKVGHYLIEWVFANNWECTLFKGENFNKNKSRMYFGSLAFYLIEEGKE